MPGLHPLAQVQWLESWRCSRQYFSDTEELVLPKISDLDDGTHHMERLALLTIGRIILLHAMP
jgi:hypothetical protein